MGKRKGTKITSFQGLRGAAMLLVILSHCNFVVDSNGRNVLSSAGALGVSIFIFLSGYLAVYYGIDDISASIIKGSALKKIFLKLEKKIKKCYPLHILTLLAAMPFATRLIAEGGIEKWFVNLLLNAFLLQAWIPMSDVYFGFNAVSWYLSLTMFLVLVSPWMVWFVTRLSNMQLIVMSAVVLFAQTILVCLTGMESWSHWVIYVCPGVRCMDFFVGGGGICVFIKRGCGKDWSEKRCDILLAVIMVFLIVLLVCSMNRKDCLIDAMYASAFWTMPVGILLLLTASAGKHGDKLCIVKFFFESRFLVFVGDISFELFMIHQLCIRYATVLFRHIGWGNSIWLYICAVTCAVGVSYILHYVPWAGKTGNSWNVR